ncbi:MAG TPA: helix-turn-helix domain-containing protein [Streptosporangiaceae bacterium]
MADDKGTDRRERADRILDTAKDLLLRWGYRRVTIDEIAARSGVGKGTVYLHWRTREQLFMAVAAREAAAMYGGVADAMAADPGEVALHRYMRRLFVEAMERPVLRAVFTRDTDTLGKLLSAPAYRSLERAKLVASHDYLRLLIDAGLLRDDLSPADIDYPLTTIVFGFFAAEPLLPPDLGLTLHDKADHLADALRRTFGPAREPSHARHAAAAPGAVAAFRTLADEFRAAAYGADGGTHE